jgi:hypothetical protein
MPLQEEVVYIPQSLVTAALAALLVGVPSPSAAAVEPSGVTQARDDRITFYVENRTGVSLNITVDRGGTRAPLGRIGMGERRRFEISAALANSEMRLVASRFGAISGLESEAFRLSSGDEIAWHIHDSPGARNGVGWAMLVNSAPRDAHRYRLRG